MKSLYVFAILTGLVGAGFLNGNTNPMETGLSSRCVLDSQYLAGADQKGFQFEKPSGKYRLDLEKLANEGPEISFHNAPYRRGSLQNLGLNLIPLPGVQGTAVYQDGEGDNSWWEVDCYRPDSGILMGTQSATAISQEGISVYGRASDLGWPLLQKSVQSAWIFFPTLPAAGLPGNTPGRVIDGQLAIGEAQNVKLRLPGAKSDLVCKRIKLKFSPRKSTVWTCSDSGCNAGVTAAKAEDPEILSFAKVGYVYWQEGEGIVAQVTRMGQGDAKRWSWQWFSPQL